MRHRSIAKSAGIIGFATLCSRILGFLRDVIIANLFGTAKFAQAFVVAFRIPNLLRDLVGEGATNAAFVPVLTQYQVHETKEKFWKLVSNIFGLLSIVLVAISLVGVLATPVIVRAIAPGFYQDPEKLRITIQLTRAMFPYLILIGLTAYFMGVLNSLKHFSIPAFGPAILNIMIILSAVFLAKRMIEPVFALAIGVLAGGIAQVLINIPVLINKGMRLRPRFDITHSEVKKIGKLLAPRAVGACVYQLSIFVDTIMASLATIVGEGGVAALYYANRIIQFPMAIFAISIAQAALPAMSAHAAKKDIKELRQTLSFALRSVLLITIPSAVGLLILAKPIVRTLFERGEFSFYSTNITSSALLFYSFGLFAYAGIKVLVSCFYSMHDTATPVKVASASLVLNIFLNLILMFPLKIGGLALATSCAAFFNFSILFIILRKKMRRIDGRRIIRSFLKIFAASIFMGAVIWFVSRDLSASLIDIGLAEKVIKLSIPIFAGIFVYAIGCFIFRVEEVQDFWRWVLRKK